MSLKDSPICSALILVKNTNSDSPVTKEIYPKDFSLENEKSQLESSVRFPKESHSSFISVFNTHSYCCTAFNFPERGTFYSIVALSKFPFYDFFRFMFNAMKKAFDNGYTYPSSIEKFDCIRSAISNLPKHNYHDLKIVPSPEMYSSQYVPPSYKITVPISNIAFLYNFNHNSFTYEKFKPSQYFTQNEYINIWHSLLINDPVLIVTKDHINGPLSVLAAASLFSPLPFTDEMCLWLNSTDPRFEMIKNGKSKLLLCATHPDNLSKIKNYFKMIINLRPTINEPDTGFDLEIYKMMRRTLYVIGDALNKYSIKNDPYYNIIESEINQQLISEAFKKNASVDLPSLEEVKDFEKTQSFKEWRLNLNPGEEDRDVFLNIDPENYFKDRSLGDLQKIEKNIGILIENYSRDAHIVAVLKHHRKVIHNMLSCD